MASLPDDGKKHSASGTLRTRSRDSEQGRERRRTKGADDLKQNLAIRELTARAELLASRGRHGEALACVEEAVLLQPSNPDLHHGKGKCLEQLGRREDALAAYDECLKLDSKNASGYSSKARIFMDQQQWKIGAEVFRHALGLDPANLEVRHNLARCLVEQGLQHKTAKDVADARAMFHDAIKTYEAFAPAYFQLGVEFSEEGEMQQARAMYTKAVQSNPQYIEAWNNLGVTCKALGELHHAVEAYENALRINGNCCKTRENMAIVLIELGCKRLEAKDILEAASFLKKALVFNPTSADVHFNLGVLYTEKEKWDKSLVHYELCVHFRKEYATAYNNMGVIHRRRKNFDAAILCYQKALEMQPKQSLANKNLGAIYGTVGQMVEAIELTRSAIEVDPNDAEALNNLALLYRDQGDCSSCLESLDRCLELDPQNRHVLSNRLMTLCYPSENTREEVFEAHRAWAESVEAQFAAHQYMTWHTTPAATGRLRVGYLSPDFYAHSVSYYIHAALRHHDPTRVEVTCYSDCASEDAKTETLRSLVPRWRRTLGLSDEALAQTIRDDGIDILVELTGHTGNNRLHMLARKPAPIAMTWIGYPNTTGLKSIDYRISDERADPPDAPGLCTEQLVYHPSCFLCYTPPENAPPPEIKLAQDAYGAITFGCFNTLAKISTQTLRLWSRLLLEVPHSRLFLKSKALRCAKVQERYRKAFAVHGVQPEQLDLSGLQPHTHSHLQLYGLVDVALDTMPYAGTTTTCEAMFMGVPVVTLRGHGVHAQNVGASLLHCVRLPDLVAETEDEYVRKAAALGYDRTRLSALRAGLRSRMLRSVLCDGARHTRELEELYRDVAANHAATRGKTAAQESVPSGVL